MSGGTGETARPGIVITRAVQTSIACPAQWDLWDAGGNYYYARFRHGTGAVRQYESENWADAPALPGDQVDESVPGWIWRANSEYIATIATFAHGDELDGEISLEKFCELAGLTLAGDAQRSGFGDYIGGKLAAEGITAAPGSELERIIGKWNEASG